MSFIAVKGSHQRCVALIGDGCLALFKPESTDWLLAGVGGRADAGLGSCGAVGGVLGRVGLGMGGVLGCRRWVCVGASVPGGVV